MVAALISWMPAHADETSAIETLVPSVTVEGTGFQLGTLANGQGAYANRAYVWAGLSAPLSGLKYTKTQGGVRATIRALSAENGLLLVAIGDEGIAEGKVDLTGWQRYRALPEFAYSDAKHTVMTLWSHPIVAGQALDIPQGTWSGSLVIAASLERKVSPPPGVVIDYSPASTQSYIGSPSIVVMPDGSYLASHDFFGPGSTNNVTHVFASNDRGAHWRLKAELQGQWWSSLFIHRGALYIIGVDREMGNVVIRRSIDGGATWTLPTDADHGQLFRGSYGCAPTPVIVHAGRVWRAFEHHPNGKPYMYFDAGMISARDADDVDLLKASSWQASEFVPFDPAVMIGDGWLEGNAVPTPDGGVANILRVQKRGAAQAAFLPVSLDGRHESFDPAHGYVGLPTGDAKFSIRQDPRGGRYWSLVNDQRTPGLNRNVLALVSSKDLQNWRVESVVLKQADPTYGFQYVDFQFDGDDLIYVSRTAWDEAHSFHDANYLTFGRIPNFRAIDNGEP